MIYTPIGLGTLLQCNDTLYKSTVTQVNLEFYTNMRCDTMLPFSLSPHFKWTGCLCVMWHMYSIWRITMLFNRFINSGTARFENFHVQAVPTVTHRNNFAMQSAYPKFLAQMTL